MSLPIPLTSHLQQKLSDFLNQRIQVTESTRLYGGDINETYVLNTTGGKFFLKINVSEAGADFFEKEKEGLDQLRSANTVRIPQPYFVGVTGHQQYLVMEYLEKGRTNKLFWEHFGNSLASLHRNTNNQFGLAYDNYIGRLSQSNSRHLNWPEFYADERILKLVRQANSLGLLNTQQVDAASRLCARLVNLIPDEAPALLHGDLWSGNFMVADNGQAAIFDPAIYYGHREMDLAMTQLFGGFEMRFYQAYHESFPLHTGWQLRTEIFQLYPLLVHLLLFGVQYLQRVSSILMRFR
jgi:fructosamine-3-kinase